MEGIKRSYFWMPSHMKSGKPVLRIEPSWSYLTKRKDFTTRGINDFVKGDLEPVSRTPDIGLRSHLVELIRRLFSEENRGRFGVVHQAAYNFIMWWGLKI
jgi:hypothetical protein